MLQMTSIFHAMYTQDQALLLAAENGHSRCVRILLESEANVDEKSEGYNCLMKAIKKKHRYNNIIHSYLQYIIFTVKVGVFVEMFEF